MTPIEWLNLYAPGFALLSDDERRAIMEFSLLWSFFEARALDTAASSARIGALVKSWNEDESLSLVPFAESLAHYKQRYFRNGAPTEHYAGLLLRPTDNPALVEAVLNGANEDPTDCVTVLLIVVYRLRNNLIHGMKWAYGIADQRENFLFASAALVAALNRVYA